MQGLKGSGSARFALYDETTDVLENAYYDFGNQTAMAVEPSADTVEVNSTDDEDYGDVLDSETEPAGVKVTGTTNRFSKETLAMMFASLIASDTTASGSVSTPQVFSSITLGVKYKIGSGEPIRGITNEDVEDENDTTTYVNGTDYDIDDYGFIVFKGTTIQDGDTIHLNSYDYAARDEAKINVNSAVSRHIQYYWKGKNRFDNKVWTVFIPKCTIKASKALDLQSKDPSTVDWELTPIKIDGYDSSVIMRVAN